MGSVRVQDSSGVVRVYDATGQFSQRATDFVRHCGLSLAEHSFASGELLEIPLVDMSPPLSDPQANTAKVVELVGGVVLSADEQARMRLFISELWNEYKDAETGPLGQYCIHPHFQEAVNDAAVRRYSCVGFVFEAYLEADIELVDIAVLPEIDVEMLVLAYPDSERHLRILAVRDRLNLAGDGPWPVLLPGYIFHAMNRDPSKCRSTPFQVSIGNECFPTK